MPSACEAAAAAALSAAAPSGSAASRISSYSTKRLQPSTVPASCSRSARHRRLLARERDAPSPGPSCTRAGHSDALDGAVRAAFLRHPRFHLVHVGAVEAHRRRRRHWKNCAELRAEIRAPKLRCADPRTIARRRRRASRRSAAVPRSVPHSDTNGWPSRLRAPHPPPPNRIAEPEAVAHTPTAADELLVITAAADQRRARAPPRLPHARRHSSPIACARAPPTAPTLIRPPASAAAVSPSPVDRHRVAQRAPRAADERLQPASRDGGRRGDARGLGGLLAGKRGEGPARVPVAVEPRDLDALERAVLGALGHPRCRRRAVELQRGAPSLPRVPVAIASAQSGRTRSRRCGRAAPRAAARRLLRPKRTNQKPGDARRRCSTRRKYSSPARGAPAARARQPLAHRARVGVADPEGAAVGDGRERGGRKPWSPCRDLDASQQRFRLAARGG